MKTEFTPQFVTINGGNPRRRDQILKGIGNQACTGEGGLSRESMGLAAAGETSAEDATTATGTGKLCETETERLNCTLFTLFAGDVDNGLWLTVSMPLAFAPWRTVSAEQAKLRPERGS